MPELRLLPIEEVLSNESLRKLRVYLAELEAGELPEGDDAEDIDEVLNEDQLTDFMDRLEAQDMACDIYLPLEFEGVVEVEDRAVGSAFSLLEALEDLREELDIDDDSDDSDEDDLELELEVIEENLAYSWRAFLRSATRCIDQQVPLHVLQ